MIALQSKIQNQEENEDILPGYREIMRKFCTRRHHNRSHSSYGTPPQFDPEKEIFVGEPIDLGDEIFVNTEVLEFDGYKHERSYHLIRSDLGWRIDKITEKSYGELTTHLE